MHERIFCVYILTNQYNTVLYTGVTNNLRRRVQEHRSGKGNTFRSRYLLNKLVYFETGADINAAIHGESRLKQDHGKRKSNW